VISPRPVHAGGDYDSRGFMGEIVSDFVGEFLPGALTEGFAAY
jgi:hypothetical protein